MRWRCWEEGESHHEAAVFDGDTPDEAAEAYAEREYHDGDAFDELEVYVRLDEPEAPQTWRVHVRVDLSPCFYGRSEEAA